MFRGSTLRRRISNGGEVETSLSPLEEQRLSIQHLLEILTKLVGCEVLAVRFSRLEGFDSVGCFGREIGQVDKRISRQHLSCDGGHHRSREGHHGYRVEETIHEAVER